MPKKPKTQTNNVQRNINKIKANKNPSINIANSEFNWGKIGVNKKTIPVFCENNKIIALKNIFHFKDIFNGKIENLIMNTAIKTVIKVKPKKNILTSLCIKYLFF